MSTINHKFPSTKKDLESIGLKDNEKILWNLTPPELYEEAIQNGEIILTKYYALRVLTGSFTGRSPNDKFIVDEPSITKDVDWGDINQPISQNIFDSLHQKMVKYLVDKSLYVKDLYAGADEKYPLNVRIVSEVAYHALFNHNMFIRPSKKELKSHEPEFTVLAAPNFKANPKAGGINSSTFILISFEKKIILIGGTLYSGEVKKSIFSVINYLLPKIRKLVV